MKQNSIIAIDLAKNIFQVCILNEYNKIESNKSVSRNKLIGEIKKYKPTTVAMEACYSSHYWARTFRDMGHTVKLIPAQHVKPFVRGNKNDNNDVIAIAEASQRPSMHFVPVKTVNQQDIQSLHRMRERIIRNRTGLINQTRGILSEYGIIASQGAASFGRMLAVISEPQDNRLSPLLKQQIQSISDEYHALSNRLENINKQLQTMVRQDPLSRILMSIPGIGFINASGIVSAIGNGNQFSSARELAVWMGLTPKQHASGEKSRMSGMSKRGNSYLRKQLINGARVALNTCKADDQLLLWARKIAERRGKNKAAVALANRMARLIWTLLQKGEAYKAST